MGEDATHLALVHRSQEPGRHGDGRVAGAATRGEGVRLGSVDDVEAGHRDARPLRKVRDGPLDERELAGLEGSGAVRLQGDRVAEPEDADIEDDGDAEGEEHAGLAAEHATGEDEDAAERGQQGEGLEGIGQPTETVGDHVLVSCGMRERVSAMEVMLRCRDDASKAWNVTNEGRTSAESRQTTDRTRRPAGTSHGTARRRGPPGRRRHRPCGRWR